MRTKKGERRTPKDRDPRPEQRGLRKQDDLDSIRVMLGFPAAILALCALRERILGARKSPSDEPRPSTGGSTIAEWELQRRVHELANEEELRAEFSSEELAKITGLVDIHWRRLAKRCATGGSASC